MTDDDDGNFEQLHNDHDRDDEGGGGAETDESEDSDNYDARARDDDEEHTSGAARYAVTPRDSAFTYNGTMTAMAVDNLVTPIGAYAAMPAFAGRQHKEMVKLSLKKTKERIKTFVKTELFRKVKFIREEIELDFANTFYAGAIMSHMGVDMRERESWWTEYKVIARQALSEKRATICASVKLMFKGKLCRKE